MSTVTAPTVGLALIARNEAKALPILLGSVAGAFDQVVLVDTGSRDKTVEVFTAWADAQDLALGYRVEHFAWCDDFAAARAFADDYLVTDWTCWADCDDRVIGAEQLRRLAAEAPPELLGYIAGYDYARDEHGNCCCYLKRERLVRRGAGRWSGRVHEAQLIEGPLSELPRELVEWVHLKEPDESGASSKRNLRILRKWVGEEPENPRVLGYLGTEELARSKPERAVRYFRRYLKLKTGWDEERAQIHRKLGMALISEGRHGEAIATALQALQVLPSWPDSYLTLAEANHQQGEWAKAAEWARETIRRGVPETFLIVNPLDYLFQPRMLLASSLAGYASIDEAIAVAEEALALVPDHPHLRPAYQGWLAQRKREATAATVVGLAQMLMRHDEQLKALALLEQAAPHFVTDHHNVVALRSMLRERVNALTDPERYAEHYATGGSRPEDMVPDDRIDAICAALPRCRFLVEGLREQKAEAA